MHPETHRRVLVLGGTAEARELADRLHAEGVAIVTSLAGRVGAPRLPAGEVRIGGFGGPGRMAAWLAEQQIAAVVDATHPFAEQITLEALAACTSTRVPLVRLERAGWNACPGDRWHQVDSLEAAAALAPRLGERILLAIGRQGVKAFADVAGAWLLIRCIEPPEPPLPQRHQVVLDRGPFTLDAELEMMRTHQIDVLVCRNSGGASTEAKLSAARRLGLPVVMVRRPSSPVTACVDDVMGALDWVRSIVSTG